MHWFPVWGAKRQNIRRQQRLAEAYSNRLQSRLSAGWDDGTSGDRLRGAKWLGSQLSAQSLIEENFEARRDNAKDLFRKNPYAASACRGRVDHVVGSGITYQSRIREIDGLVTESQAEEWNKHRETKFREWAQVERFAAKQRLAELCIAIYGECFVLLSDQGSAEKPVPLHLQIITPERIETPPKFSGDANVRLGVRTDRNGDPIGYYVRRTEPNDNVDVDMSYIYIPRVDPDTGAMRLLHSFEQLFPGQLRGVPWLAPAMSTLKDLKDFTEANLISEQVAACFSGFIRSPDPYSSALKGAAETDSSNRRLEELAPGIIQYLGPEDEIEFANPSRPGNTLKPYVETHLRAVAAALRYPYELLVKEFSNNFSGGRLAMIDGRMAFRAWQRLAIDDLWHHVGNRFNDELTIVGAIDIDPRMYSDNLAAFRRHSFISSRWEWVDPLKDVQSHTQSIAAGIGTQQDAVATLGNDIDDIKEQRFREQAKDLEIAARLERRRMELESEFGVSISRAESGEQTAESGERRAESQKNQPQLTTTQ